MDRMKKSCRGCHAMQFNRRIGVMDCTLGYKTAGRRIDTLQPLEVCPKPRNLAAWAKALVVRYKAMGVL
jgi:hypothetical protein